MSASEHTPRPDSPTRDPEAILPIRDIGDGPPVVFLHGYPLDHRMWGPDVGRFLPRHRIILVDLPGYGDAQTMASPDSLEAFSEAVDRTLQALSLGGATIVGHSMGGYIALQLYRTHSERFGSLVLTNTRSKADSPEARDTRLAAAARLARPGESLAVEDTVRSLLATRTIDTKPDVVDRVREIVRSVHSDRLVPTLRALANRPDFTPVLPNIRVPTLVVWGDSDGLIPPAQTSEMVTRIPGAVGQEIPGAGHLPSLEAPKDFYGSLDRFLSRLH